MNTNSASPDVFISYASEDLKLAETVVQDLELAGVRCWLAPRDVPAGEFYADSIVQAIDRSRVTVLILSRHAAASPHVAREVERTASQRHKLLSLKTDREPLPAALQYFLNTAQWLDTSPESLSATLPTLISAVRHALTDAQVKVSESPPAAQHVSVRKRTSLSVAAGMTLLAVLAALSWALVHRLRPEPNSTAVRGIAGGALDATIAVLPFADMSEQHDQEYFADGMAEEVLDLLAKIPAMKVIGRTSSFQFKGKNDDLRSIGERLNANYVVEGSVRKAGSRVRVTAQLINARAGTHLWSETYDRDFGDVLLLQTEMAGGIARALQLAVGADDLRAPRRLPSTDAYNLYLHARTALDQLDESTQGAIGELEQALQLDPSFAQAAEVLALLHAERVLNQLGAGAEGWRAARAAAETALRLDPASSRARAVLGLASAEQDFDWASADDAISQALAANPRDPFALDFAARLLAHRGRYAEALRRIDTALSFDPLNPYAYDTLGIVQYLAGDFPDAERSFLRVLSLSPTFYGARVNLAWVLLAENKAPLALEPSLHEPSKNGRSAALASVYFALSRKAESDAAITELLKNYEHWPCGVALAYASRGDVEAALHWLETSYQERDPDVLLWIAAHPFFTAVRQQPRFQALMREVNLGGPGKGPLQSL